MAQSDAGCSKRSSGPRYARLATSRLFTNTWPSRWSTSGPVEGCQPKWSPVALRSVRSKDAGVSTNVLLYTRASAEFSTKMPLSQRTKTLPATVTPREISKKKPLIAPSIQLFTKTPSRLPTSYQTPFE